MKINSRQKGKRRELELVHKLKDAGYANAQRSQQVKGTVDSFDVECPGSIIERYEMKGRENLNVHKAMDQAREEAEGENFALVWKKNRGAWVVILDWKLFESLLCCVDDETGMARLSQNISDSNFWPARRVKVIRRK